MHASEDSLKIAVLIDFDNIEIGVKTTLNREFEVGAVLDAVKERGDVITKVAYGDWKRAGDYSRLLTQHAVRMVQRNMTPGGDKNGADINLALDALEMAFTHDHINAFVIVGGDSDFISLVEKLKQYDKKVFVVGGRQFTGAVMQKNCHEFIAYENLIRQTGRRQPSQAQGRERGGSQPAASPATLSTAPVSKAFALVTRALGLLTDREVTPQLGLLKSTLLQLDSTFSERDYGASSFRDFADKLAEAGLVTLRSAGRSVLVELKDAAGATEGVEAPQADVEAGNAAPAAAPAAEADLAAEARGEAPQTSIVDGIRLLQRVLATPGAIARWPMYVRNVKQAMRAAEPGFDERKHGNLVEILRSVQRDGLVRLDRDRQGVLRVFQGPQLRVPVAMPQEPVDAAVETDEQGLAEAAPIVAPDETADVHLAADAPESGEPAQAATGVAAAVAGIPTTDEPDAEVPSAEATPRRRRKAGTAAPRSKSTTAARKPRARAATPRRKKTTENE